MKVAAAQLDLMVGALQHNFEKICHSIEEARAQGVHLLVFPELTLCGYIPEDLLFNRRFIDDCQDMLERLVAHDAGDVVLVVGYPRRVEDKLFNACAVIHRNKIERVYDKQQLPNYLVFDEKRYFTPGRNDGILELEVAGKRRKLGVNICEDIWYNAYPVMYQIGQQVDVLVNLSASPYATGKIRARTDMLRGRCRDHHVPLVYCNQVGGQDDLVFDGNSCVINQHGELLAQGAGFAADLVIADLSNGAAIEPSYMPDNEELYRALVLATRDYILKNGFQDVVIGLSGGIDSALTAAIAVDALGAQHVTGVLMPSRYSSDHSVEDAVALAENLKIQHKIIHIEDVHGAFQQTLNAVLPDYARNLTDENVQARIRGVLLMAWSNNHNAILLTTGNKSEIAVGFTTLYGDMAGGYAVIKDVFKTQVYELCHYRNSIGHVIPNNTLTKAPSAELRHDHKDTDSLPEYPILDQILKAHVHEFLDAQSIVEKGFDPQLVAQVIGLVKRNEYKRRQAPPGPRVTKMSFGKDRRMPLTNGYG